MNLEVDTSYQGRIVRSRASLLPIAIGLIMVLIDLAYILYGYQNIFFDSQPDLSKDANFVLQVVYELTIPTIVLGVALLLAQSKNRDRMSIIDSKLVFLSGSILIIIGSIFNIATFWIFYYSEDMDYDFDLISKLGFVGSFTYLTGIFLCAITTLFLARSYIKKGFISSVEKVD